MTRNLCGSGEISKANQRKRLGNFHSGLKTKQIKLEGELLEWVENDSFHSMIDKTNKEMLKALCQENGIPRAGGKGEVAMKVRKTIYAYQAQQAKIKKAEEKTKTKANKVVAADGQEIQDQTLNKAAVETIEE